MNNVTRKEYYTSKLSLNTIGLASRGVADEKENSLTPLSIKPKFRLKNLSNSLSIECRSIGDSPFNGVW
jgi:hypothetical protein